MSRKTRVTILIPCLNEKLTIKRSISDALKNCKKIFKNNFEILVADNGSSDGTLNILKKIKSVKTIKVPVKGYGAALHYGILSAKGEYIIFADADLSYPFANLKEFKEVLIFGPDLTLGSRFKGTIKKGAMPLLHKYLGTPILTYLIRLIYQIPTTDCNSGMRMVKKVFYQKLNMRNSGMEWASEILIKTALRGGKYVEVPIRFVKDSRGRKAHLSTWSDGWRHLKAIILLRPVILLLTLPFSISMGIFFYKSNFGISFLMFDSAFVLFLSYLTLKLLESVIENKDSTVAIFLKQFKLVQLTLVASFVVALSIYLIPDNRLGTKLFLVSILGIGMMWIFLIETIKTHLVNRLPDKH